MKLESVALNLVSMQLQAPFETSFGVEHQRQCIIVRVAAEGSEGWGECVAGQFPGYSYETSQTAWSILSEFLIPAALEANFEDPLQLQQALAGISGHPMAKAGLELAVWDLIGRREGRPLVELLGQSHPESLSGAEARDGRAAARSAVPVGVSIGIQPTTEALLDTVAGYLERGYRRVKLKIKPGRDREAVNAVRRAHPELALQVDANTAYASDQLEPLVELDRFGLLMIEQPFPKEDLLGHVRLSQHIETPVCLDESIGSALEARQAVELGACQVVNIKAGRVGGLSEAVAIHDWCYQNDTPVWCGGMLETGIGRAANLALAALPGFTLPGDISATERYYAEDVAWPRFELDANGEIAVPTGPGLGIEIDPDALDRFTLRRETFA